MRVLLDTHAFLWFAAGDSRLPSRVLDIVENPLNDRFVSMATCWEITIKHSIGRLNFSIRLGELFNHRIEANGLVPLNIERRHLFELPNLVMAHKDPFDRLLVAQSKVEGLTLLSNDQVLDAYGVPRIW